MTRRRIAAAAALAACLGLSACNLNPRTAVLPGGTGNDGYKVTATFSNVDNLVPNSEVQYHDVRIGTVQSIDLDHATWQAKVRMGLKKNVAVPHNVTAKVGQKSLLGAEYVELDDPAKPQGRLAGGDTISPGSTGMYPGTEEVLSAVSLLLNNGGLSQIKTITSQLNDALDGREDIARSTLQQLTTFVSDLDQQKAKLIATTESLNTLAGSLADNRDTVAKALQHITPAVSTLNKDRPDLTTALTALGRLSTVAQQVLDRNRTNLQSDLAYLKPTLTQLATAGKAIPDSLPLLVSFPFPITTVHNAVRGDYMNLFETLDISLPSIQKDFLGSVPIIGTAPITDAKNPLLAPVKAAGGSTTPAKAAAKPKSKPKAATTPTPTTTPKPTPSPTPSTCNILTRLLGGC